MYFIYIYSYLYIYIYIYINRTSFSATCSTKICDECVPIPSRTRAIARLGLTSGVPPSLISTTNMLANMSDISRALWLTYDCQLYSLISIFIYSLTIYAWSIDICLNILYILYNTFQTPFRTPLRIPVQTPLRTPVRTPLQTPLRTPFEHFRSKELRRTAQL